MTVREYIGARYVPVFSDPIQWDNTLSYEPLTVVMNLGTSYVSRQSVPAGIAIDNEQYWIRWADYNAQLEEYIRQVQLYSGRIEALENALPITLFDDTDTVDSRFDTIEADDWVTTDRIADSSVTTAKIADDAITGDKIADASISDSMIVPGTIGPNSISNNCITSAKISNGTIQTEDLANGIITPAKMQPRVWGFIGDSFSDDAYYSWVPTLAQYLGETVVNKAHSGASFYNSSNSFISQLTALANDSRTFTDIIVSGGVNDTSGTTQAIQNAVIGFCTYLKQNFPHYPRLHLFIGNMPHHDGEEVHRVVSTINNTAIANYKNAKVYTNINGWQIAYFGWQSASNIHPSNAFLAELPRLFYKALKTGNTDISVAYKPQLDVYTNIGVTWSAVSAMVVTNEAIYIPRAAFTVSSGGANNPLFTYGLPASFPDGASNWRVQGYQAVTTGFGGAANSCGVICDMYDGGKYKVYNCTPGLSYTIPSISIGIANG